MKVSEVFRLLEKDGCVWRGQKEVIVNTNARPKAEARTIAGKPSIDVSAGTLNSVLKPAGLK